MLTNKKARVTIPPVVAAVVRPVNTRLSRIEDLLLEMRGVQDIHLKRIDRLHDQVAELVEMRRPVRR